VGYLLVVVAKIKYAIANVDDFATKHRGRTDGNVDLLSYIFIQEFFHTGEFILAVCDDRRPLRIDFYNIVENSLTY